MGVKQSYVNETLPKLIKYYVQDYYISCAQGPKYQPLRKTINDNINRIQCHICLFGENTKYQQLQELCKDLRTKINMLVTKLVGEVVSEEDWSCQLVIDLVMFIIV